MFSLKNKNVLVVGLGISGRSAANFLIRRGALVDAVDCNRKLLENDDNIAALSTLGVSCCHEDDIKSIENYDLIVVSPGIPGTHRLIKSASMQGIEVIGEVELALRTVDEKRSILGVTGTNGKTTVVSMIAHVLNFAGIKAEAVGNIGIPLTFSIDQAPDVKVFVVELSSFQLETLHASSFHAGVCLNITPDHLDRYANMEGYAKAKSRLQNCLKQNGQFFVEEKAYHQFKTLFSSCLLYGYHPDCYIYTDTKSLYLKGDRQFALPQEYAGFKNHDLENLMAVYSLCHLYHIKNEDFLSAAASFVKPHHRIEFVQTINGVTYYDDSKGTNVDAVISAVNRLVGEIILIAGGVDKGSSYTPWIKAFDGRVKAIFAIGKAADKIREELRGHLNVALCESLEQAVVNASNFAKQGNIVLLSPGCSSYDMFKDYAHRGQEFQRIVNSLGHVQTNLKNGFK